MTAAGGVIQISARGVQDAVINGNPTHTIWRSIHTRFTSCALDDDLQELSTTGFDTTGSVEINRYGDLISRIALEVVLPPLAAPQIPVTPATSPVTYVDAADTGAHYVNAIGFALWDTVKVIIGGTDIDELFSDFAMCYEELAGRPGLRLETAIGRVPYSSTVDEDLIELASKQQTLYVPLPLWISKYQPATWGQALPIVALKSHKVEVKVKTRPISECVAVIYKDTDGVWQLADSSLAPLNATTGTALVNSDMRVRLLVTSVFLDQTERTAITSVSHSFLINTAHKQAHSVPAGQSTKLELKLYANHPSSSLIWFARPLDWATSTGRRRFSCGFKDRYDFTSQVASSVTAALPYGDVVEPVSSASLTLNGHSRWPTDQPINYFRYHVPYTSWRTMPTTSIYSYTFALEAAEWQPTSTLNFSRMDHVSLGLNFYTGIKASELFTINEAYNLLLVERGMSGLRFSN